MMKLDYAGGEVMISDALCHALLDYSAVMAREGGSENLQIPVLTMDGVRGMADVVVGPASQLLGTPTADEETDLGDSDVVDDIQARTTALLPHKAMPLSYESDSNVLDDESL